MNLAGLLQEAAGAWPANAAFRLPGGASVTFAELDALSARIAEALADEGVGPGDRVGVCLPKSIDSVAVLFGIMRTGAAYVPTGIDAPASRTAFVFEDCRVRTAFVDAALADDVVRSMTTSPEAPFMVVSDAGDGAGIRAALEARGHARPGAAEEGGVAGAGDGTGAIVDRSPDDTAYILYTSGSTGVPKGVTLSHGSARAFIDWCAAEFAPEPHDRFSSHAPFHFDLSILDLYVPMTNGATSVLLGEAIGKDPKRLAAVIEEERITSWYSTPSVLGLMLRFGGVAKRDVSSLRQVLFAGEVMPVGHLRDWVSLAPDAAFYNLYGPTETNVCTFLRIPDEVPADRETPYPIGIACPHYRIRVVDEDGADVEPGGEGELVASGPGVMKGYWGRPDLDERAFFADAEGIRWYRTGDIVVEQADGVYDFRGRRDRMVKRRGYRVELDEIEVALHTHPDLDEAAVVAVEHPEDGVAIHAFLCPASGEQVSVIALKSFCLERLPPYMVPDRFAFRDRLPKTRTDKVDYVHLQEIAAG